MRLETSKQRYEAFLKGEYTPGSESQNPKNNKEIKVNSKLTGKDLPDHHASRDPGALTGSKVNSKLTEQEQFLWRKIHTDPFFKMALGWLQESQPIRYPAKYLKGQVMRYGESFVRETIKLVADRDGAYFSREHLTEFDQRSRLLGHILKNKGIPKAM